MGIIGLDYGRNDRGTKILTPDAQCVRDITASARRK